MGSTIVKELRGTESTRKSIQKLKRGDERINVSSSCVNAASCSNTDGTIGSPPKQTKRPLFLFISHRGVQFTDLNTQVIIIKCRNLCTYLFFFYIICMFCRELYVNMKSEILIVHVRTPMIWRTLHILQKMPNLILTTAMCSTLIAWYYYFYRCFSQKKK